MEQQKGVHAVSVGSRGNDQRLAARDVLEAVNREW
jgi:hypothetical protein